MSKIATFILVVIAFFSGILFQTVYPNTETKLVIEAKPAAERKSPGSPGIEASIPFYCSGDTPCEATLNNGVKKPLRLIGDKSKTWVVVGDEKIASADFYQRVYWGKYPEGVAIIDFKN